MPDITVEATIVIPCKRKTINIKSEEVEEQIEDERDLATIIEDYWGIRITLGVEYGMPLTIYCVR